MLLPFIAGMAVAYALDPVADWFERRGFSRMAASLIILVIFVLLLVLSACRYESTADLRPSVTTA